MVRKAERPAPVITLMEILEPLGFECIHDYLFHHSPTGLEYSFKNVSEDHVLKIAALALYQHGVTNGKRQLKTEFHNLLALDD